MVISSTPIQPSVAAVLVNWNGWRECIECLDTLLAQDYVSLQVFVVDNGSNDGSCRHLSSWLNSPQADPGWRPLPNVRRITGLAPGEPVGHRLLESTDAPAPPPDGCRVTLIRAADNRGFAAGCNLGVALAGLERFDYFWFLNPDTAVARDALGALIERAAAGNGIGMVGSTLLYYSNPNVIEALGGARLDVSNGSTRHIGAGQPADSAPLDGVEVEAQLAYVVGASMLVPREFIREVGPMSEQYFLYYEEIDWAIRARGRYRPAYAPRSRVFHKSGANSSKVVPTRSAHFYYRSRLLFVSIHLPQRIGAARRSLVWDLLRHLRHRRWGHVRALGRILAGLE
ncbi:MAG: glycosyltransferase family 2 protein [Gammaproteobacteria bacterium]|nr:glycosyltransferase family 2 protein [Gammaproteobacteria bacterium]